MKLKLKLKLQLQMREIRQSSVSELDVGVSLYFGTQWWARRLIEFTQPLTFQIIENSTLDREWEMLGLGTIER